MENYKTLAGTVRRFLGTDSRITTGNEYRIVGEEFTWNADHSYHWDDYGLPAVAPIFTHYLKIYDDRGHPRFITRESFD